MAKWTKEELLAALKKEDWLLLVVKGSPGRRRVLGFEGSCRYTTLMSEGRMEQSCFAPATPSAAKTISAMLAYDMERGSRHHYYVFDWYGNLLKPANYTKKAVAKKKKKTAKRRKA